MESHQGLIDTLVSQGVIRSPRIEEAFRAIDRRDFVRDPSDPLLYADRPLPIGEGQTISQPRTVAMMLEWLDARPGQRVLDVGSGSGWTTALLAHIVGEDGLVLGLEVKDDLVSFGRKNLRRYDMPQASIEKATAMGAPDRPAFDRILVNAAGNTYPHELEKQLVPAGVIVVPVENSIVVGRKDVEGAVATDIHHGFSFVPLVDP